MPSVDPTRDFLRTPLVCMTRPRLIRELCDSDLNVRFATIRHPRRHLNKSGHSETIELTKKRYTSGDPILSRALKRSFWFSITAPG